MDGRIEIGQLVCSKQGRDLGKYYLVLEVINDNLVYLVDGEKRRMDNPKQKNVKHLKAYSAIACDIVQEWEAGKNPGNNQVCRVITQFKQSLLEQDF